MFALICFLVFSLIALGTGLLAALSDYRGMTIPNIYSAVILGAFLACFAVMWLLGVDDIFLPFFSHVIGFAIVFVITLIMFAAKLWGGGDQKLMSAFSIWFGLSGLPAFFVYTTLFGGMLGLSALALKKFKLFENPEKGSWIATVQAGEGKVPYGIAIALGALASFFKIGYFSIDTFRIFVAS